MVEITFHMCCEFYIKNFREELFHLFNYKFTKLCRHEFLLFDSYITTLLDGF
ncbi:hypothetical protein D3C81_1173860 [compost metagenome]